LNEGEKTLLEAVGEKNGLRANAEGGGSQSGWTNKGAKTLTHVGRTLKH